ncbi:MAG: dihydropteroate synthase [Candidatus Altiarchaeota archaeon]
MALKDIRAGAHTLRFDRTLIMGVLNVTPDSFSDGGLYVNTDLAVEHALRMVRDGADIIDIGGESTRPGAPSVTAGEELNRVRPVIQRLAKEAGVPLSIDTYKHQVASECVKLGANMINDITGLTDKKMIKVASDAKVPVVIMHMKGLPQTMQTNPVYADVVQEVKLFLQGRVELAHDLGVDDVIVDPGIGFGKTTEHNLKLIKNLGEFRSLGCPILVGPSRKSFIGNITGLPADARMEGTLAAVAISIANGANIIRVHDVAECKKAAQIADAIKGA